MRFCLFFAAVSWSVVTAAQENPFLTPAERAAAPKAATVSRFFENEPFDLLKLNDKERTELRIVPLDLPGRRVPKSPDPKTALRVRLLDHNGEEYDVTWGDVAELRLFEQLLLDEAARLGQAGRFDEAFDYFVYLRRERPTTPGLEEAEIDLGFVEAAAALRGDRPDVAYARLLRLEQRAPRDARLADLSARTTQQLAERYLATGKPRAAKAVAERFAKGHEKHAVTTALLKAFQTSSDSSLAAAQQALAEGRYLVAQRDAQTAAVLAVNPAAALDVYRRAVTAHPAAVVGVVETAPNSAAGGGPAPSWAARRLARLRRIPTFELVLHVGDQTRAAYESTFHRWEANDRDPQAFRIRLASPGGRPSAADVAATLLAASRDANGTGATPSPPGNLELRVVDPQQLDLRFGRLLPRPEALVADVLASRGIGVDGMLTDDDLHFHRSAALAAPVIAELEERPLADEDEAVTALLAGEVDAVDRIAPWQTARLRAQRELRIVRYAAPSVHLLLFNAANPLLRQPELRRAIGYALDREAILKNHLQPERDDLAARVIDGVFPAGRAVDDPLGYAYDAVGDARQYNPQRAFVLAAMSGAAATTDKPLVLSHPATLTAARACRRIVEQLAAVGISVELQVARADRSPTGPAGADLTYVTTSSVEPLVDAAHWFGPGGLVNLESGALGVALAELSRAESMPAARAALFEIQRVVHDEALVAPLWQFSEYAVHRGRLVRPADVAPTSFYQQFERWAVLPQFSEALP